MSDIVGGVKSQVWRIIGYYGSKQMSLETIPWKQADVEAIIAVLKARVSKQLANISLTNPFRDSM